MFRLARAALQIAAGNGHTCALTEFGKVQCWGVGEGGALGYGNPNAIGDDESPADAGEVPLGAPATQIVAGNRLTCALTKAGAVRCWGEEGNGHPGTSRIGTDEMPSSVGDVAVGGVAKRLAAGSNHVCALLEGGTVRCWGTNVYGELGYGTIFPENEQPPAAYGDVEIGAPVVGLAAGDTHTCALLEGGRVRCWGWGKFGQLGYGNTLNIGDDELPSAAGDVDVGGVVVQLAAGGDHTCALLRDGCVRCWGMGQGGQLGSGSESNIGDDERPATAACVRVFE